MSISLPHLAVAFFISASSAVEAESGLRPFWKMECLGSAEPAVNGYLEEYNARTGEVIWVMTDKDGMQGRVSGRILGAKVEIFGNVGTLNSSRTKFKIDVVDCPNGFVGEGFN